METLGEFSPSPRAPSPQEQPADSPSHPRPTNRPVPFENGLATPVSSSEAAALRLSQVEDSPFRPNSLQLKRYSLAAIAAVVFPLTAALAWAFYLLGVSVERSAKLDVAPLEALEVSEDFQARLDEALFALRNGQPREASDKLSALERQNPALPSLTYFLALSLMQAGDVDAALAKADASIAKREKVSESLTLKAALETRKAAKPRTKKFGDPTVRAEVLLRQAILADQSNPAPYAELATILRTRRQTDEARKLLESARLRVNPLDTPSLLSTALALLSLQEKTTAELPDILASDKDAASLFSAIYVALRKEDRSTATTLLQTAQEQIPPELFSSLLNDPALRYFSLRPQPNGPSSVPSTSP